MRVVDRVGWVQGSTVDARDDDHEDEHRAGHGCESEQRSSDDSGHHSTLYRIQAALRVIFQAVPIRA